MRTFRALVVDNDKEFRKLGEEAEDASKGILVDTAADLAAAQVLVAQNFYNVAYVDLHLETGPKHNTDGKTLLRELYDARPSCRRILVTKYPTTYREEVFGLIDPEAHIIDGALDKDDFKHLFVDYLRDEAHRWLMAPVELPALEEMHAAITSKKIKGTPMLSGEPAAVTREELDYVVSRLFGQGLAGQAVDPDSTKELNLRLLEGGKSRSIVTVGMPVSYAGGHGIQCVVKIGSRQDTIEEQRRYEQYVRFRMSLHRRVELLGSAVADTIGAVCYSFAGRSPSEIEDLQGLLDRQDPRALDVLEQLLGQAEDWQSDGQEGRDLAGFFSNAYGLNPSKIRGTVADFAEHNGARFGARKERDELLLEGVRLRLPTDADVGAGVLRGSYGASVVHGDLNASNVIVAADDGVILIDFRHTTRGPRALDFAALHASVRLSAATGADVITEAARDAGIERLLWTHDWSSTESWWPAKEPGEPPYWGSVAACLMRLAHESLGDLSTREHAVTTLLYCLRVFRVEALGREARFRLLVWMSALIEAVERERD
jgi:CheY-like chemotaxis protein